MDFTTNDLPVGVSRQFLELVKVSVRTKSPLTPSENTLMSKVFRGNLFGIEIIQNDMYPITLKDGTVINGLIADGKGGHIYIVDSPQGDKTA